MGELKAPKVQEVNNNVLEKFQNIKPTEKMSQNEVESHWDKFRKSNFESNEKQETGIPEKFYTSLEQREALLPKSGEWTGKPGESKFISGNSETNKELAKFGLDGIEYHNGVPDFSKCSVVSERIDDMTPDEGTNIGNFYKKLVEEGKFDSEREAKAFKQENGLAFHECADTHTCQLIPEKIHQTFTHIGGRLECRLRDLSEGIGGFKFDE